MEFTASQLFPASQLYITLAISGATLGVYVSNAKHFKMGRKVLIVPMLFVFVAWGQLLVTLLATLFLQNKPNVGNTLGLCTHIFTLYLFVFSIFRLTSLIRDQSEVDFPS